MQGTDTIPGGLPHNTVNINQVKHLLNHFIGSLTTGADGGFAVMKLLDAVFINAEACRPNGKQHCDKLARNAKGIAVSLAELEESGTKLRWVNDRICTRGPRDKREGWASEKLNMAYAVCGIGGRKRTRKIQV